MTKNHQECLQKDTHPEKAKSFAYTHRKSKTLHFNHVNSGKKEHHEPYPEPSNRAIELDLIIISIDGHLDKVDMPVTITR